ncbi:LPS export ABC transporter permease LptG [Erythrobacteraceae bacterium CFH 75059]|uniref:LPS export ABC transporter permease LptG n=1 Tax=Qipengyuania thermophila TaxID=2509361 RepID=UPI00102219A2|nr:LPS export ABC transporter permease LptG [Qipengyuania thermophila]TCD06790.1 LPS export ABC transporter permease LptG [Erythrobacteraceae bacterium CFH 75059]
MQNLDFFPSRTLTVYLARLFVVRIAAVLVMLILVLMMLDLLAKSGEILAVPGNGQAQLLTYVSLRMPELVETFLPYSVLLATIITLLTLNQNSEVIAMKAAGMSAFQVLAPLLLTALVVSGLSFAFNERIVTRATATLSAWSANDYAPLPPGSDVLANVYLSDGTNVLMAETVSGHGESTRLSGVTWYRLGPGGLIAEQITAPAATYAAPGWRLTDATRFSVERVARTAVPEVIVGEGIQPDALRLSRVNPDAETFRSLGQIIEQYRQAGRRTSALEASRWHKLSGPLAAFLMPLLGAIAAFGLARSGKLFVRALIGMALGFAYFVFDNAALAMGSFGGYPPVLAAWLPFVLFFLIGQTVLVRTEE